MKPEVGGVYVTAGGHVVGPLEEWGLEDWYATFHVKDIGDEVFWNQYGTAEGPFDGDRIPEYDIVGVAGEGLKIEDFI
jgi:hypothetical protein